MIVAKPCSQWGLSKSEVVSKFPVYLCYLIDNLSTAVKLGNKERFDKEQIGIKERFLVTNSPFTS